MSRIEQENLTKFLNQHSIKTVNAELVKAGYALSTCHNRYYYLHYKERGKPDGDICRTFTNKTRAFNYASEIMNQYWRERQ